MSSDFTVAVPAWIETLQWGAADDAALVLGIWESGMLLATMSVAVIHGAADARQAFDGMVLPPKLQDWPAPILTRAATRSRESRRGLNALLRLHLMRAVINGGAGRLFGYVTLGGSRTRLLEALGYQFLCRTDTDSDLPSMLPWAAAFLDLDAHGQQALERLAILAEAEAERYPWFGPPLEAFGLGVAAR